MGTAGWININNMIFVLFVMLSVFESFQSIPMPIHMYISKGSPTVFYAKQTSQVYIIEYYVNLCFNEMHMFICSSL